MPNDNILISRPSKVYQNWNFGHGNIRSGSPGVMHDGQMELFGLAKKIMKLFGWRGDNSR
jgi:hypothetical protein